MSHCARRHRPDRTQRSGQSAVEFALIAPFLFFLIFTVLNGGIFMFAKDSADNANTIGSLAVAAEGRDANADTIAVTRMSTNGLGANGFSTVQEIDIYKLNQTASGGLVEATGCNGSSSAGSCRNRYTLAAAPIGAINWPPSQRVVSSGGADFGGITVIYQYQSFYRVFPSFTVNATLYFRLEAQT